MPESDNPKHKPALLESIPADGATVSTMARIWKVSTSTAFSILQAYREQDQVRRSWRAGGVKIWKRVENG